MSQRECAPCTACCEGWLTSKKMNLKPGSSCQHCSSSGCGIYEERPVSPCQNFKCAWLTDEQLLPDEMQPNLCGAIVIFGRRWKGIKVILAIPTGQAIPEPTLEWLRRFAIQQKTPLLFCEYPIEDGKFGKTTKTGFGPPAFVDAVKQSIGPSDVVKF